ncbi:MULTISPECIES: DGQHR domain-containing protein [unclassified Bradyrhizobium]|uniref:DGQHR domain-containing protein n=1 Tax=unclassified Bradyrhizobium TaxID=2631580 RepID=UPI001FF9A69B|nr:MULTISPECIES: DGQHR domain-containing protein [unclassified Bradyrhizobium]MCK1397021.1 DGQHR domain-containing protein [Bradyrhizobium sp. 39]MCK1630248.1 DGQHR domain-containing protein [Bradyrhizobium sp. 162]MCK1691018.1 DGQHR domain-containing protein [Bradyrhizobium sp. 145]MCK1751379.1 DGQHR domain-containing protein [Bradyrhizobium sp. 135]UPJ36272.1 DGQHR domain-containing protein [Bradyrhizobium sp. 4]
MKNDPLIVPALRGAFGDWIYYSCVMEVSDVGARVNYAHEIHPDEALSQLIQRSLEGTRARHIASYLASTQERFFNSLVLATYGGKPDWLEIGNFKSPANPGLVGEIPPRATDALGFLALTGKEKIFAIDGQHRLAGIKQAMKDNVDLAGEQVSVILVGHKKDAAGLQRTRRLFTTLNKTAVPVAKRDIIALDEDDVMAITCRRLVETNSSFRSPKIAVISSQAIPAGNKECLTTIANLYDILKLVFSNQDGSRTDRHLRFNRPSEERLDQYYKSATDYFAALGKTFKPVTELLSSTQPSKVAPKYRTELGGHLLFRPIGLEIVTRAAIKLARDQKLSLPHAAAKLKKLPVELDAEPYVGVIWDAQRRRIIGTGKALARDLVMYMVGVDTDEEKLLDRYRSAVSDGSDWSEVELPLKVV